MNKYKQIYSLILAASMNLPLNLQNIVLATSASPTIQHPVHATCLESTILPTRCLVNQTPKSTLSPPMTASNPLNVVETSFAIISSVFRPRIIGWGIRFNAYIFFQLRLNKVVVAARYV